MQQPTMGVITGLPTEALMHMEVMQVMDMSNRTGQETMKNSQLEKMLATEDITMELMFQTGALMVMEEVMEEIMMPGVEIGKLVIQTEDRGETRVLDTGVGEEEVITAQREMKAELEPWKN